MPKLCARIKRVEIKTRSSQAFYLSQCRNLTAWADNGVLMLNTCLTVQANKAGSHSNKGWETFTDKVVDVVDKYGGADVADPNGANKNGTGRGVVFLAWGAWAAKRVAKLNKASGWLSASDKETVVLIVRNRRNISF